MSTDDLAPREYTGPTKRTPKGLILVYTGYGKGKSTAAFGAAFRSLGRGLRVAVVQFIKGKWVSGEIKALEAFGGLVEYHSVGEGFTWETKDIDKDKSLAQKGWDICIDLLKSGKFDLYLFDELVYVLKYKFLEESEVIAVLKAKPSGAHVILTGRDASPELMEIADLVTEMKEIKHPFSVGITAQPGIDF